MAPLLMKGSNSLVTHLPSFNIRHTKFAQFLFQINNTIPNVMEKIPFIYTRIKLPGNQSGTSEFLFH